MSQPTQQAPGNMAAEDGRLSENRLAATQNPALARLASAVAAQSTADPAESYSRMHHRHNRN